MYWRTAETTLKTLLMEVFCVSTPTYSGNYKANLESFPVEYVLAQVRACRAGAADLVERDSYLLASLELSRCQRVNGSDLIYESADISALGHASGK
jgi:hypothetical protein